MKDGTYIGGFDFEAGGSQDYNQERQEIDFVIEFTMPIDISQVELVVIGNERLPIKGGVNSYKKIESPRIESAVFRVLMIESCRKKW